jgi:hypothetical protein
MAREARGKFNQRPAKRRGSELYREKAVKHALNYSIWMDAMDEAEKNFKKLYAKADSLDRARIAEKVTIEEMLAAYADMRNCTRAA